MHDLQKYFQKVGQLIPMVCREAAKYQVYGHPYLNLLYGVYHGTGRVWWKMKTVIRNGSKQWQDKQ